MISSYAQLHRLIIRSDQRDVLLMIMEWKDIAEIADAKRVWQHNITLLNNQYHQWFCPKSELLGCEVPDERLDPILQAHLTGNRFTRRYNILPSHNDDDIDLCGVLCFKNSNLPAVNFRLANSPVFDFVYGKMIHRIYEGGDVAPLPDNY